jgi:hypothetical protein
MITAKQHQGANRLFQGESKQAAKPLAADNLALLVASQSRSADQQGIAQPLVVTLFVVVLHELRHSSSELPFREENQMVHTLCFNGEHKSLGVGVQIGAPRW